MTELQQQSWALDTAHNHLRPKTGTRDYSIVEDVIQALPLGNNASFDKVLLQTSGCPLASV